MVMTETIVDTYGHGHFYCGYSWSWPLLLWILMVMTTTIVDAHGNDFYLLWILMAITFTHVDTNGNNLYSCRY